MEKYIRSLIVSVICLVLVAVTATTANCGTVYPTQIRVAQAGQVYAFIAKDSNGQPIIANIYYQQYGYIYGPFSSSIGIYMCDLVGTFTVLENSAVIGSITVNVGGLEPASIGSIAPMNVSVKVAGDSWVVLAKDANGKIITDGIQFRQGNKIFGTFSSSNGIYACDLIGSIDILWNTVKIGTVTVTVNSAEPASIGSVYPTNISVKNANDTWVILVKDTTGKIITDGVQYRQGANIYGTFASINGIYSCNLAGSVDILWNAVKIGTVTVTVNSAEPASIGSIIPDKVSIKKAGDYWVILAKDATGKIITDGIQYRQGANIYGTFASANGIYSCNLTGSVDILWNAVKIGTVTVTVSSVEPASIGSITPNNISIKTAGDYWVILVKDANGKIVTDGVQYRQGANIYGTFASINGIYSCNLTDSVEILVNAVKIGTVKVTVTSVEPASIGSVYPTNISVKNANDTWIVMIKDTTGKIITDGVQYRQDNNVYGTFSSTTGAYTGNLLGTVEVLVNAVKIGTVNVTISTVEPASTGSVFPTTIKVEKVGDNWTVIAKDASGNFITSNIWYKQNDQFYGPFANTAGKYASNLSGSVDILWNLVKIGTVNVSINDTPVPAYTISPSLAEPSNGLVTFEVRKSDGSLVKEKVTIIRSFDSGTTWGPWTSDTGVYSTAWLQDIDGKVSVYVDGVLAGEITVKPNPTVYVISPTWVAGPTNGNITFSVKTAAGTAIMDDVRVIRTIDPSKTYGPWTTIDGFYSVGWDDSFGTITVYVGLLEAGKIVIGTEKKTVTIASNNLTVNVPSYGDYTVYGTSDSNTVIIAKGGKCKLVNFPGNNKIYLASELSAFKVYRSGATTTLLECSNGTKLQIPATSKVQSLYFGAEKTLRELVITGGKVKLGGNQEVTLTSASVN